MSASNWDAWCDEGRTSMGVIPVPPAIMPIVRARSGEYFIWPLGPLTSTRSPILSSPKCFEMLPVG